MSTKALQPQLLAEQTFPNQGKTMSTVTDIRVIGFDEERPPKIQTRPCIDLNFQLDQEAPAGWCNLFASVIGKPRYSWKIAEEPGLFIETWVRTPGEIEAALVNVKEFVKACNAAYDEEEKRKRGIVTTDTEEVVLTPEQIALNKIVDGLFFDSPGDVA